jgi:hypothetical protein
MRFEGRLRTHPCRLLVPLLQGSREPLPEALVRDIRYLATIRNKLIHERGFDRIPDRPEFIQVGKCLV